MFGLGGAMRVRRTHFEGLSQRLLVNLRSISSVGGSIPRDAVTLVGVES